MILDFKKTDDKAIIPTRGSKEAAGYDLHAVIDDDLIYFGEIVIPPGGTYRFRTGIAIELPPGYFGALYARSGMADGQGLVLTTGTSVIDSDYRGEVFVGLRNLSQDYQKVYDGERIAQLVVQKYEEVEWRQVSELHETERGTGGFGSTGRK